MLPSKPIYVMSIERLVDYRIVTVHEPAIVTDVKVKPASSKTMSRAFVIIMGSVLQVQGFRW